MATAANLKDGLILRDWSVFINNVGKIGQCSQITLPEINLEMVDYRGGGMFGTVEIPMGLEKLECSFDLMTWDSSIWSSVGLGAGSQNVPLQFQGTGFTMNGAQQQVFIDMEGTLKAIKTDAVQPGKEVKMSVMVAVNKYTHSIAGTIVHDIDIFNNTYVIDGVDIMQTTRNYEGFAY